MAKLGLLAALAALLVAVACGHLAVTYIDIGSASGINAGSAADAVAGANWVGPLQWALQPVSRLWQQPSLQLFSGEQRPAAHGDNATCNCKVRHDVVRLAWFWEH